MGKSQSKDENEKETRIALVGPTGSGKTTFVKAITGLGDVDEDAGTIAAHTLEPSIHRYPLNQKIVFHDLPGYDEIKYPNAEKYCHAFQLGKFEGLLIIIKDELTEFDLDLAKEIQSIGTPFLVIRTHIDQYCLSEEKPSKKPEQLEKIKNEMIKRISCENAEVFLINTYDSGAHDFSLASKAINKMVPFNQGRDLKEEITNYVKQNVVSGVEEFVHEKLVGCKNAKMQIAVTGNSGTGKSSFINAIRGLKDDDVGAAKVGEVETTGEAMKFKHPGNENIVFVDLPGMGTIKFPEETYCKKVGLKDYDTFLILTTCRFTENDLKLAKIVKEMGKPFFLLRTKIDHDFENIRKRRRAPINEQEVLEEIRSNCYANVKDLIHSAVDIFLISNHQIEKWDFDRLIEAIENVLPDRQRECLILSLTNVTRECIKRKANHFRALAVMVAVTSGASSAAIPLPGPDVVVDVTLLISTLAIYNKSLGLKNLSPDVIDKLPKDVQEIITMKYQFKNVKEFLGSTGAKTLLKSMVVEEGLKFIPIVGQVLGAGISFTFMLHYLLRCIKDLEKAALAVWDSGIQRATKEYSDPDKND